MTSRAVDVAGLVTITFAYGYAAGRTRPLRRLLDWLIDDVGGRPCRPDAVLRPVLLALAVCVLTPPAFLALPSSMARWWRERRAALTCSCGHGPRPHDTTPDGVWFCLARVDGEPCPCHAYDPWWERRRRPVPVSDLIGAPRSSS